MKVGWIANIIVLIGTFLVGEKRRSAFLWLAAGEALWAAVGLARKETDIAFVCIIFTVMALVNYYKWGVAHETS